MYYVDIFNIIIKFSIELANDWYFYCEFAFNWGFYGEWGFNIWDFILKSSINIK